MDVDASYVNAGYLSPSHLTPLSAAWVMKQSLKWMFNPSNPLYIKPRWDADFLKWTYVFNKSFNLEHAKKAILCIKALAFLRQELYGDIKADQHLAFHYMKEGLYWKIHKMLKLSYCYRSCYDGLEYGHRNW